jgi:hypothetical protein
MRTSCSADRDYYGSTTARRVIGIYRQLLLPCSQPHEDCSHRRLFPILWQSRLPAVN